MKNLVMSIILIYIGIEVQILIALMAVVFIVIMPIWALVNIMTKNKFEHPTDKTGWVLIVLFLPVVGWIIYASTAYKKYNSK